MGLHYPLELTASSSWTSCLLRFLLYGMAGFTVILLVAYLYIFPLQERSLAYRNLPGPKSPSIFWGSIKTVLAHSHPNAAYDIWLAAHGPTLRYNILLGMSRVLTIDTTAISYILSHPDLFPKPVHGRAILGDMLGKGWCFSPNSIKGMAPIFFDKAYELKIRLLGLIDDDAESQASPTPPLEQDKQPNGRKIDMLKWTGKATLDVIGLAGFDYDFQTLEGGENELAEAYREMFEIGMGMSAMSVIQGLFPALRFIPTERTQVLNRSRSITRRVGMEIIQRKKQVVQTYYAGFLEKNVDIGNDLLSILIKANMAHDILPEDRLSDDEVLDQITTFMLAGNETSSTALTWVLYTLSQHPTVQHRLRAELQSVPDDHPPIETLLALPYMDAVVKEVLRLSAPIPMALREAAQDCVLPLATPVVGRDGRVLDSVALNRGTTVLMPNLNVNTSEDIWGPTASQFIPDRFLDPIPELYPATTKAVPGVYHNLMTFLGGSRNCIGYRFALAEMKVMLFVLIRGFEFEELNSRPEIERKVSVVMRPRVVGEEEAGLQLPLFVKPLSDLC
ncbi:hypothetical protein L202_05462 [Cryptococcus amylolentus CBS 6039]|uniref:Cytochrome P450 n=1 Tax=Cryptococcus amylolentus CBS 6039 TaxID=1295533 RepID=A0A1E3HL73_9TREE|nr:hypothetical protein L202_05462 [Cryptococcus amylolentus CBS 6039]ODN76875.1 hypothetical protein L202_05462 [Cryptococcus amylolentus CBS 6039]